MHTHHVGRASRISKAVQLVFATAVAILGQIHIAIAATTSFNVVVRAGEYPRNNTPCKVLLHLQEDLADSRVKLVGEGGREVPAQLTALGLLTVDDNKESDTVARELHFIIDHLDAGKQAVYRATISTEIATQGSAAWDTDDSLGTTELRFADRPVLRYMHAKYDPSTTEKRDLTYKVYHHLFDPSGKRLVTKGPGGLYPHHRGLYFGFNKITYGDGKKADTWHCTSGVHQANVDITASEAGPVLGRHLVVINWVGEAGDVFATEQRQMTAYNVPGAQLVDFASKLQTKVGPVHLDGDPQHAGFQFRVDNEVAEKRKDETYYLRPHGKGEPGKTLNWPESKQQVNLDWNVMSFMLGPERFSAVYLDRPGNPKEARYSEREYGRFGSYFVYDLTAEKPLELNYRLWLQPGELTAEAAQALSHDFVAPPEILVTDR